MQIIVIIYYTPTVCPLVLMSLLLLNLFVNVIYFCFVYTIIGTANDYRVK